MKWSENTVVLFSTGAMETLQNLLQKISDLLLPLWSQRQIIPVALSNNVSMVATFALRLMRAMLGLLVEGEDSFQYRDMRVVTVLVTVHAVFCSIPYSTIISSTASEVGGFVCAVPFCYGSSRLPMVCPRFRRRFWIFWQCSPNQKSLSPRQLARKRLLVCEEPFFYRRDG